MSGTSGRRRQTSLIKQLKRRLLVVVGLLVFILIFCFPIGIINVSVQRRLDGQQIALQRGQSDLLLSMLNQASILKRYIASDDTTFLRSFTSSRQQYLLTLQQLKNQARASKLSGTTMVLAQVEKQDNAWYSSYAQVQIKNMQSGKIAEARTASAGPVGSALFDKIRTALARLQQAEAQDFSTRQIQLDWGSRTALITAITLSTIAMIILWRNLTRLIRALTAQLTALKTATSRLGSGDLEARVQDLQYHELNDLGQTFNNMAEDLATHSREVERTNSELRERRDELLAANAALEEANRVRSEFLSTMSHELRTPLASIIGFSQMLLDDAKEADWSQQQQNDLERILKNGQHLLGLINDVLDLSKIEAGRMTLKYSRIDVQELLTSVVEETQSMALAQPLVLRAEVEDGIGFLESDPLKLRQVLLNLVSNAIKFTEQGEVTVSATRVISSEQQADQIALAVKDTGIGIPSDVQERIFEAFYQADSGYTRKFGGTGLGLSIVRQLTELLGGTIALKSAPGQGSTFTVTFPITAGHHAITEHLPRLHETEQSEGSTADGLTREIPEERFTISAQRAAPDRQLNPVLAIDDNPDAIALVKAALQDTPFTVVGVQEPLDVMELVRELQPCAIILDVMMPRLNGWQILHQLKARPVTSAIPVVMLSVIEEQTTGYVLGADDYLIKPFQSDVLLNTLRRLIAIPQGSTQARQREARPV